MEWIQETKPIPYENAVFSMERRVADIHAGTQGECVWFLEHPPLYTAGTSAKPEDLRDARFPVHQSGRGGQYTYHGPGQRVAYVMLDLKKRHDAPDLKKYIYQLEEWIIRTLAEFGIQGERRAGRVGIWVAKDGVEAKIAAIGVRVRHWIAYHGISINIDPDLSHFDGIVPCGIAEHGVTSMKALLGPAAIVRPSEVDQALQRQFAQVFG